MKELLIYLEINCHVLKSKNKPLETQYCKTYFLFLHKTRFIRSLLIATIYELDSSISANVSHTGCKNSDLDMSFLVTTCTVTWTLEYKTSKNYFMQDLLSA